MARKRANRNAPDLHCHSTFSLLDGFGSPESVVVRAVELGWGAACLSEHGWMGSAPTFYQACKATRWWKGSGHEDGAPKPVIKPILACELYVVPDEMLGLQDKEYRQASKHLTVLALSAEGYHNLVRWTTLSMHRENFYHKPRISVEAMIESAPYGLHHNVVLSGCMGGELCQCLATMNGSGITAGAAYIESMKSVFPNFYVELQHHRIDKFVGRGFERWEEMTAQQDVVRAQLLELARRTRTPTVLTNDSHFQSSAQRKAHIAMLGSKLNRWTKEEAQGVGLDPVLGYAYWTNYMQSMEAIEERTPGAQGSCQNVLDIVAEADIRLDPLDKFSYSIPDAGYGDSVAEIRRRIKSKVKSLVRKHGDVARERIEHELAAMGDFADYLLMMSDFIIHARKEGILTNTRGSAANSLLCHALKIHDIDSIEYKLTFERFVNPERKKLPDIDIDIQYDRYEDFMKFVQQYVGEREGDGNIALLCNYGMFANRSTFRTVAESLGMPQEKIDEIADLLPQMIDSGLVDEEEDVYAALKEAYPEIYDLAAGVFDNMKSVGQHACGWIFGTKDRPLDDWIPRYLIASSGQLVTQYDYKSALLFGFNKGDFLRLKMLKVVADTLKMIGRDPLDIESIPLDDPDTFEMIREGRTEGIFTLQGKTNRQGGIEVEPVDEHGVIASVAIYRPSLTRPGYHNVYNRRRRGDEETAFPSDLAESVLGESYGLPIFQEQILEMGYAAGFDHNEAQELLDAIKLAKGVGRGAAEAFEKIHPKWVKSAMKSAGLTEKQAEETWKLVGSFEGYGFNRGHATSYGRFAVKAAYLKCHHPQEYFVSLLDTYPEKHKYVAGAKAEGFRLVTPDINRSTAGFSRGDDDTSIRVGLARIKGIGPKALTSIIAGQPFSSIDDLKARTPSNAVKVPVINSLAAVGAFQSFGIKPTDDDSEMLKILGFLLDKPKAMKDIKPIHVKARTSNKGWRHAGLYRGVDMTAQKSSISKLFWIPEITEKLLQQQASAWARVKTWLLLAIDENGIPFHIMANEDRPAEVKYLQFIAAKHRNSVLCLDGAIRKPFDTDGPMGFRFFDVSGAYEGEPQVWVEYDGQWTQEEDDKLIKSFTLLHNRKMQARRAAA